MSSSTALDHDPLTLDEVFSFLKRHAVKLAVGTLACAALGIGLAYVLPAEWEATAIVQVGQVQAPSSPYHPTQGPVLLETPARTVERLKADAFTDTLLGNLGLPIKSGTSRRADLIRNSFNARVLRTSELVEIRVRDFSQQDAQRTLLAVQNQLIRAHAALLQPTLDRYKSDYNLVSHHLADARQRLEQARKLTSVQKAANPGASTFAENVLLTSVLHETEVEISKLQLQLSELNEQMSPTRTFNTRTFSDATVSQRPVFPRRSAFLLAGAIFGLVITFAIALIRERQQTRAT